LRILKAEVPKMMTIVDVKGGHATPDLELWEKVEEEKSEDPEETLIIDRGGI
jgi:hypothetical protein